MKIARIVLASTILVAAAATAQATGERATDADGSKPHVARAVLTHSVVDREPTDDIRSLGNDQPLVYFFTELRNLQQTNVTHRWLRDGKPMGDVAFHVGGDRWRVWSTKNLEPSWTGSWSVEVVDAEGQVLETRTFDFVNVFQGAEAGGGEPAKAETP